MLSKTIKFCKDREKDLVLAAIIILVALISFGLGRLSKIREIKTPITVENVTIRPTGILDGEADKAAVKNNREKVFVASKKGTKYHYPWCSGAQRIKETNKIWFSTVEEAREDGYSPAANCKGLK